ncbi:hypothetical protein SK128_003470 [Halocaridina rubra]|uniref:Gfo/Idh/MocA-like oxidoreductase N-terminal domain-containing protein n=1 Tax=Halocaridina rubra TaxID=373956 RepID=A0AAN8ZX93_HALRR
MAQTYLVGAGLVPNEYKDVPQDCKKINVALFALGRAGSIHLSNMMKNPRILLQYIVEPDREKLLRVQEEWHLPDSAILSPQETDKVFNDPSIHGIVIATPTYMHKDLVVRALKSGKAVLCEKPIAENLTETSQCYRIAEEVKRPLLCAFNRRFDPSFRELRRRVHEGAVGQIHMIKTVARDSPLPSVDYLKISASAGFKFVNFSATRIRNIATNSWCICKALTHIMASQTLSSTSCFSFIQTNNNFSTFYINGALFFVRIVTPLATSAAF